MRTLSSLAGLAGLALLTLVSAPLAQANTETATLTGTASVGATEGSNRNSEGQSEYLVPDIVANQPDIREPIPLSVLLGEWVLFPEAQFRLRFLHDTGLDFSDAAKRSLINHRARLGIVIAHGDGLELGFQLQDVRIWGEEGNTLADFDADGLDVHEAYVVIPLGGFVRLKVGRQEITLDNQRLVGNVGWTQRARSFDGAKLDLHLSNLVATFLGAVILEADQDSDGTVPPGRDHSDYFGGVRIRYRFGSDHETALSYLFNRKGSSSEERHTLGGRAWGDLWDLSYNAEVFYQLGNIGSRNVDALLLAGRLGYSIDVATSPEVHIWAELLRGNGTPEGTFDTLYATNHRFYGAMDFFLNIPRDTESRGLLDLGGELKLKPLPRLGVSVALHHLQSDSEAPGLGRTFGTELDALLSYRLFPNVTLRALYGVFFPGRLMENRSPAFVPGLSELEPEHFAFGTLDVKI